MAPVESFPGGFGRKTLGSARIERTLTATPVRPRNDAPALFLRLLRLHKREMPALSSVRANPVRVAAPAARRAPAQRAAAVRVCAAGKSYSITLLPGDGIGPEIMKVAVDCLNVVVRDPGGDAAFTERCRALPPELGAEGRTDCACVMRLSLTFPILARKYPAGEEGEVRALLQGGSHWRIRHRCHRRAAP